MMIDASNAMDVNGIGFEAVLVGAKHFLKMRRIAFVVTVLWEEIL